MEPYAEFTKLEQWDENGKPFLAEVRNRLSSGGIEADKIVQGLRKVEGQDRYHHRR
jgi:hypothetical protein